MLCFRNFRADNRLDFAVLWRSFARLFSGERFKIVGATFRIFSSLKSQFSRQLSTIQSYFEFSYRSAMFRYVGDARSIVSRCVVCSRCSAAICRLLRLRARASLVAAQSFHFYTTTKLVSQQFSHQIYAI
jgi:hypothetical protein